MIKKYFWIYFLITIFIIPIFGLDKNDQGYKGDKPYEHFMNNLKNNTFDGEPMNIHLKDVSFLKVISIIAKHAGLNVVIDPGINIKEKINAKFKQVPWDLSFVYIVYKYGFMVQVEKNIKGEYMMLRILKKENKNKKWKAG